MKHLIWTISFLFSLSLSAQQYFSFPIDSVYEGRTLMIDLQSENYYRFMNIRNDMVNRFVFGGYISDDVKGKSSSKLTKNNRFGGETYSTLNFYDFKTKLFKKKRLGYYIGIGYRNYISGNITQDLFNLAFYGNAKYAEQKMDLSELRLNNYSYYKLNIGLFDKKYKSGGNISFLYGNSLMKGQILNAELYSSEEIVNLQATGYFRQSDQTKKKWHDFNGWGFSADFKVNIPIKWFKRQAIIQIKADNIGFIVWNKGSTTYSVDSTYSFVGFDIQDLLDGNSALNNETDWMDSLNVKEEQGNFTTWLPARITIAKTIDELSDVKFQTTFGVRMITTRDYFPMVFFGVYYRPVHWFALSGNIRYGGFGGFDGGIRFDFYAKDFFALSLSTSNVYGTFTNSGYGRSVNLGIRGIIK